MWGSGRVTKGNVPGLVVTVLSNRIRFIVRVKSSCSSLERASEQLSRLEGGGEKEGETRREGEEGGRRGKGGKKEGGRQRMEVRGKNQSQLHFYWTMSSCGQLCAMPPPSLPPLPSLPRGLYLVSFSRGEDLAVVSILSSSSFPNSPIPSTGIQST